MMPKLARRTKFGKAQMERSTEQDKLQWRQATVREHELILVTHMARILHYIVLSRIEQKKLVNL